MSASSTSRQAMLLSFRRAPGYQSLKAERRSFGRWGLSGFGSYDECKSEGEREKAIAAIERVSRPAQDPVYGEDGPLIHLWPPLT